MLGLPDTGLESQQLELYRKAVTVLPDICVDSGGERRGDLARLGGIAGPFRVHVAAEPHQPRDAVAGGVIRAENFRQLARPGPPPNLDLVEAVLRRDVPLGKEQIGDGLRIDVSDAPPVSQDLYRLLESSDRQGAVNLSKAPGRFFLQDLNRLRRTVAAERAEQGGGQ